jgi:hypothetical protein
LLKEVLHIDISVKQWTVARCTMLINLWNNI